MIDKLARWWRTLTTSRLLALGWTACLTGSLAAIAREPADNAPATSVDFARDVAPIFKSHCLACHGPQKQESNYRLDVKGVAFQGGDLGEAAIVPGKSVDSPLYRYVTGEGPIVMPPKGERLGARQVAVLKAWIDQGAKWPDDASAEVGPPAHWAFQPLVRPQVPTEEGRAAEWVHNPVDAFLLVKLRLAGLTFSPPAERRTLIRRLYLDVLGLPPSPEEIAALERDADPLWYEKLVDSVLASPHYGERWARHWLDVVRFAETNGFEMNQPRPNAWHYRDWVIQALNDDLSYDAFIRQQLAGDVLGADAATGFLVAGPWDQVKSPDPVLTAQQRADELHDMISTTGSAFLGLTVGCARCHSHKFDPVPQADYYALKAVFEGIQHGERPLQTLDDASRRQRIAALRERLAAVEANLVRFEPLADPRVDGTGKRLARRTAVRAKVNVDRFAPVEARRLRFTVLKTTDVEPCLDELEVFTAEELPRNIALASAGTKAVASSTYPNSEIHKLEHVNDGRHGNGRSWISAEVGKGWVELQFARVARIDRVVWGRDREEKYMDRLATEYRIEVSPSVEGDDWQVVASSADRQPYAARGGAMSPVLAESLPAEDRRRAEALWREKQQAETMLAALEQSDMVYAGKFVAPPATRRFHRGDPTQPREEVAPGTLTKIGPQAAPFPSSEAQRRLALAEWIAHPQNPLTARVIVNRLWHYHFGAGIVSTPSDLGVNGARPTHPELLDWLACELVHSSDGAVWSLKHIHRLILLSHAYRQSSRPHSEGLARDADARLLWRFPPRRLEAEVLRDSMLAVAGQLDRTMGGPGFDLFEPNTNYVRVYNSKREFGPETFRRMVYQSKPRMQLDDTFGAFDCPDAGQIAPKRNRSTTPLQALNLLNSPFVLQMSRDFARRLEHEAGQDAAGQVRRAFLLLFGREPGTEETTAAMELVTQHGLAVLCRALFNANEFVVLP